MRILVQQKQNGLYFKDVEGWTRDRSEAMEFLSSTVAIDFCAANKLADVQLVVKIDGEPTEIVMPVQAGSLSREERPRRSAL